MPSTRNDRRRKQDASKPARQLLSFESDCNSLRSPAASAGQSRRLQRSYVLLTSHKLVFQRPQASKASWQTCNPRNWFLFWPVAVTYVKLCLKLKNVTRRALVFFAGQMVACAGHTKGSKLSPRSVSIFRCVSILRCGCGLVQERFSKALDCRSSFNRPSPILSD
jgi:hypothetical protein